MTRTVRRPARLATALAALALVAAGCAGDEEEASPAGGSASDAGASSSASSDAGGASDAGGGAAEESPTEESSTAESSTASAEAYAVTPVPEGFEAPAPCTGEGAYSARVDEDPAEPELPERSGETLTITVTGIDGDHAELEAAIGGGDPRPIEPATLGETVTIDLWTISITSVCTDTEQVEFDLID